MIILSINSKSNMMSNNLSYDANPPIIPISLPNDSPSSSPHSSLTPYLPSFLFPIITPFPSPSIPPVESKPKYQTMVELFMKGSDKDIFFLLQNKSKPFHEEFKKFIQFHPETSVSRMYPIIHSNICLFFDRSDEGLSLEVLENYLLEMKGMKTDDFLWVLGDNFAKLPNDAKANAIRVIMRLIQNSNHNKKLMLPLLLSTIYLLAKNTDMFNDMRCAELVVIIIKQKRDNVNEMLFKLMLNHANKHEHDNNVLMNLKRMVVDKFKREFASRSEVFRQLSELCGDVDTEIPIVSAPPQNLKEYLLNYNNNNNNNGGEFIDKELTTFLLSRAKQQTYSKDLQDIAKENPDIVNIIFTPFLIANCAELSMDKYAKFFVVEVIEQIPENKMPLLLQAIKPQFTDISTDKQGTRVIQSIIKRCYNLYCESLSSSSSTSTSSSSSFPSMACLLESISANIVELMTNKLSAHIVFSLIKFQVSFVNDFLYQALAGNFMKIVTNQFGCGRIRDIFQLQLTQANYCHYLIEKVVDEDNLQRIIFDQYGHYLIMYLLCNLPFNYYATCWNKIIEFINNNFVQYATHKYSSSVIEKCVESTTLFSAQLQKESVVKELAKDAIGSYVLLAIINSNNPVVKNTKRVLVKIIYKNKKDVKASVAGQTVWKLVQKKNEE